MTSDPGRGKSHSIPVTHHHPRESKGHDANTTGSDSKIDATEKRNLSVSRHGHEKSYPHYGDTVDHEGALRADTAAMSYVRDIVIDHVSVKVAERGVEATSLAFRR